MKRITILSFVLVLFLTGCQDPQLIPPQFRFYEVLGYPELGIQQCTKMRYGHRIFTPTHQIP